MFEIFALKNMFFFILSLFAIGSIGSLVLNKKDELVNLWGNSFAILGSIFGLFFSTQILLSGEFLFLNIQTPFPLLSFSLSVDRLSAFLIFIISLISLFCSIYAVGYIKHFYEKYNIGVLGFFYNIFIASMILVASASNSFLFLIVWEIMSLASYFLVIFENKKEENIRAGSLYFIMTHLGTVFITFAFLLMYKMTGSFEFSVIKESIGASPSYIKDIIFISALIGFGAKAGIIPFHIWLPAAHPAAPSHVSALMSGVMIKTAIYMLIRLYMDIIPGGPVWWGVLMLVIGAMSSLLGVLYALSEKDIKKLLAYSSIENIGIILLGLGGSLVFVSVDMKSLAILSLVASLFHMLNHAVFKSLLFLGAGAVISKTHTRNMEEYGGLIKRMPQTAIFFLVGSMAISALLPLNGFFSEWMIFQSLFQGVLNLEPVLKVVFVLSIGALALTGGLALVCFVKAFGITFLARPRSEESEHAEEVSKTLLFGMGSLSLLTLIFGIFSGPIAGVLANVSEGLSRLKGFVPAFSSSIGSLNIQDGFAQISAPFIILGITVSVFVIYLLASIIYRRQKISVGRTWDCGTDLTRRMEITATGFSRSLVIVFNRIFRSTRLIIKEREQSDTEYFPVSRIVDLDFFDVYENYLYEPTTGFVKKISDRIKGIQSGDVNEYILYIFLMLLILLIIATV